MDEQCWLKDVGLGEKQSHHHSPAKLHDLLDLIIRYVNMINGVTSMLLAEFV